MPVLRVSAEDGAEVTTLPLDERAIRAAEDRSPVVLVHGAFAGGAFELVVYTEMGYEPASWRLAGAEEVRRMSLMEALVCGNGRVTVAQTLLQAADIGALRAFLEIRVVGAEGELLAAAPWIELAWTPELVEAVR